MVAMTIREASKEDVPAIIDLLMNDPLGSQREDALNLSAYQQAFEHIQRDPNAALCVVMDGDKLIGTFQINYLTYLTYQGGTRAQIEGVRVHEDYRGQGIGEQVFEWAKQQAMMKGCHLLQLTTDKKRPEALRFYEKCGYINSHHGMKQKLS